MPQQDNFTLLLAALLVVLLVVGTFLQATVSGYTGKLIPAITLRIICEKDGAGYILAQPTSPQVCKKLDGMNKFFEVDCQLVQEGVKRSACNNLQQELSARVYDCFGYSKNSSGSSYASGSSNAVQWCDEFSA